MTPAALSTTLRHIGWSSVTLARHAGVSERLVRYWISGRYPVPPDVALGLERLVAWLDEGQFGAGRGSDSPATPPRSRVGDVSSRPRGKGAPRSRNPILGLPAGRSAPDPLPPHRHHPGDDQSRDQDEGRDEDEAGEGGAEKPPDQPPEMTPTRHPPKNQPTVEKLRIPRIQIHEIHTPFIPVSKVNIQ